MDGIERGRGVLRLALTVYPLCIHVCRQHATFTLLTYCEFLSVLAAAGKNFLQYLKLNNGVQLSITDTEKGKRGWFQTKDLSQGL